ncbi:transcription factor HES-5-like [Archocentrus centrarchus]|uniref:transcription factor HES-5-like n=1 Tax=Archocentrus centrarchus TaxID=63155 RepID=UPI0011E9FCDA|nr:transcription factor HES-5-like [Archocentrus centrarchus]
MKPAEIRLSLQRPLQHRDPGMAPTVTAKMNSSQGYLTLTHNLRKPLVEKIRRERINSCIEQLRSLLSPEFLKQQPDSKLEKGDILEMTVCFLRRLQQHHQAVDSAAVDKGYSRCVQEMEHFLSKEAVKTQSQRKLLNHINQLQNSSDKNLRKADFSPLSCTAQPSITKESSQQRSLEAVIDTYRLESQPH